MLNRLVLSASTLIYVGALLGTLLLWPGSAAAQDAGIRISPATIEQTLDPGVTETYDIEIENLNETEQVYFLFTRNISSVGPGGIPVFAETNDEKTGFELADWVDLPVDTLTLPGGGKETITITMNVPGNASPGSHFGGVFISAEPPDIENSGAAVGYQVANILSIRVSGEAIETASIRQFSTDRFLYGSQNVDFNVRIENTGNVLVRPVGPLEIFNSLGKRVGTVLFNEPRAGVFPGNTREFTDINWLGDGTGFGRYEAVLTPVYGDEGARKTMTTTVTFWILPFGIIGPALGVLLVLLLITAVGVRIYIKRAVARATAGRRLVRQRGTAGPSMTLLLLVSTLIVVALFLLVMLVLFA